MTSSDLRQKFLEFFESKGHKIIPSASLLPENDPTVLFTTAGMQPLVPYLTGQKHPMGACLVNAQKCLRTDDIDEVGDEVHHTFFEMLGNWSLGDPDATDGIGAGYWKEEAIKYSFEFLTAPDWLGIDKNRLAVSVFAGDPDDSVGAGAPFDQESYDIWLSLGIAPERIAKLPKRNNWWGPAGETGPCGPDTEMFVWTGEGVAPDVFDANDSRWVEVWNDVFMEYDKKIQDSGFKIQDGAKAYVYEKLNQKNVDTGMGLERMTAGMNGVADNYQTDLFSAVIKKIEELSGKKYEGNERAFRIVADHLRAATFILGDGKDITPDNTGQGYVLRKLIRRAARYGKQMELPDGFTAQIATSVIGNMEEVYPELTKNREFILEQLTKEEDKFAETLTEGLKASRELFAGKISLPEEKYRKLMQIPTHGQILKDMWVKRREGGDYSIKEAGITKEEIEGAMVTGEEGFLLYQSYGFPMEMILELVIEKGLMFDRFAFKKEMAKHQDLSRTASSGMFKGGLADNSEETMKLHTATHLLLTSLRKVLGDDTINQKGSNITAERLRFDFNFPRKLTDEELQKVEEMVNEQIKKDLKVERLEMSYDEAKKMGAIGVFEEKYGERVLVYKMGDFSLELCGGPHVEHTGVLGSFKITKEESSSAGTRRIKALLA